MARFEISLENSLILDNRTMSSAALEWMVICGGGKPRDVAIIDAFTTIRRQSPATASPRPEWDAAVERAASDLDPDTHKQCTALGSSMTLDEAVEYARSASGR